MSVSFLLTAYNDPTIFNSYLTNHNRWVELGVNQWTLLGVADKREDGEAVEQQRDVRIEHPGCRQVECHQCDAADTGKSRNPTE